MDKDGILKRSSEYIEDLFYNTSGTPLEIRNSMKGPMILKEDETRKDNRMKWSASRSDYNTGRPSSWKLCLPEHVAWT